MNTLYQKMMVIIATNLCFCSTLLGQTEMRSTGLILRSSYWHDHDHTSLVSLSDNFSDECVNIGRVGGWLSLLSRMSEYSFIEFSIGATAEVESKSEDFINEEVDIDGITPILLGIRRQLLLFPGQSALQPYFSFGGGPYWLYTTHITETGFDTEVTIASKLQPGIYGGGGFDFMLSRWFGFNFDCRYHYINFDKSNDHNGFEFGLGLIFEWGTYTPER